MGLDLEVGGKGRGDIASQSCRGVRLANIYLDNL